MSRSPSWDKINVGKNGFLIWGILILVPVYLFVSLMIVQFFCLFFLFILIGSRLYSEYLVRNIRIIRCDKELRVFKHEWVKVELRIENKSLLPAFMAVVNDSPGSLAVFNDIKVLRSIPRRSWIIINWQGHCSERGVITLGPATIRGSDPLGLFPFCFIAHEKSNLFVYPSLRSINIKPPGGIPLGNMLTPNPLFEDITRRRSLRPYQSGDELRRINWKVSARLSQLGGIEGGVQTLSGGLMINEYDATASYPLMIFLNLDRSEYPPKRRGVLFIERAIEAAAALCLRTSLQRQELGIIIYIPRKEGLFVITPSSHTIVLILEQLAAVNWNITSKTPSDSPLTDDYMRNSARAMLEQGKYLSYGTRYLYVGPDLGDEAYININLLKRYHLSLEYLIIDERSMPPMVPGKSPRYQMKEQGFEII
jgi:uncharacterized protein (DUF58 family)